MTTTPLLLLAVLLMPALLAAVEDRSLATRGDGPGRESLLLERGWSFHLGDVPMPVIKGHGESYMNAKAGVAHGAAQDTYDDSAWRTLDLPHDWAVEGGFDKNENLSQGYRARGVGWYRRQFMLEPSDRGKHLELRFDGIATHANVWVNNILIKRNFCGYTGFSIDITSIANYGDQVNTIAVRVDATPQQGWWYEGAGIYRHVWLVKQGAVHLVPDGVFAQPVRDSDGAWTIPVEATLANDGEQPAEATVTSVLVDAAGREVARGRATVTVPVLDRAVATFSLLVANPTLWSTDDPYLYRVRTAVSVGGEAMDGTVTPAGFRTIRFVAGQGLFVNDRHVQIKGTCNHQDHAGVGTAIPDSLLDYRVRRLKALGSNAYRSAHNPPTPELLDACDRHGLLVLDENRDFNVSDEHVRMLEWMVRRDRNHPSVFLWSVFNEEPMQGSVQGYEMVRRMVATVKRLDRTRPVTAAMNGGLDTGRNVAHAVDVVGLNYQTNHYDDVTTLFPGKPALSTEDTSAFMTRGAYEKDDARHIFDSYDRHYAPWGANQQTGWKLIDTRSHLAGGFVWTGFDYRGEPSPHQWPSAGSFFGLMDLCGFPKAAFHWRQAMWIKDRPVLSIIPHWDWAGREGKPVTVMAITNAESSELFVNGVSAGVKVNDPYAMTSWEVPYQPGAIEVVARRDGRDIARRRVETTGPAATVQLVVDPLAARTSLRGDGEDALPLTVSLADAQGRWIPTADQRVEFRVTGPAAIIGVGNGDPNNHESEKEPRRSLFNGLAQVIIQSRPESGTSAVTVTATVAGLPDAVCTIPVEPASRRPGVAAAPDTQVLTTWRLSPTTTTRPDPTAAVADFDQNTWTELRGSSLTAKVFRERPWGMLRTTFTPSAKTQTAGGTIIFGQVLGAAEVWCDGRLIGSKPDRAKAPLRVELPPGAGPRTLTLVLDLRDAPFSGWGGIEQGVRLFSH
jgi:beta-galactosidase